MTLRLFEPDDDQHEPSVSSSCTPDMLLAFIEKTLREQGRYPTDAEAFSKFGKLNTMVSGWKLMDENRLPRKS